ncbi:hypothetical protein BLNAU_18403 [Blattamonas nauphoetae]|uniref:Uncharacterized protein n=1 Tax=Blattamonas nauphoetae TaxID=2049346 RepID=A0ABQ9X4E8_9EUKA|nr:hypothetical protein BLNAU_18403 [Blattamonas nauphoetae]
MEFLLISGESDLQSGKRKKKTAVKKREEQTSSSARHFCADIDNATFRSIHKRRSSSDDRSTREASERRVEGSVGTGRGRGAPLPVAPHKP